MVDYTFVIPNLHLEFSKKMETTAIIGREQIEKTKMFRSLNSTMQHLILKTVNIMKIQEEFKTALTFGFEAWERNSKTSYANRSIIKELLLVEKEL